MSDTNDPGDLPEVLPVEDGPPHVKRHCPVCGGEDFIKFSATTITQNVGGEGVAAFAHLLNQKGFRVGSHPIHLGYSFIDLSTGKELEGHTANPFLRLCLSCGFMAWHLGRADRDRIRELRDRLMNDRD